MIASGGSVFSNNDDLGPQAPLRRVNHPKVRTGQIILFHLLSAMPAGIVQRSHVPWCSRRASSPREAACVMARRPRPEHYATFQQQQDLELDRVHIPTGNNQSVPSPVLAKLWATSRAPKSYLICIRRRLPMPVVVAPICIDHPPITIMALPFFRLPGRPSGRQSSLSDLSLASSSHSI